LSTQPYLLPAIIGYGVVTVAVPTLWLLHAKNHAKLTTEKLNKSFWEQAIDQPEIFVECITNWSALYEPNYNEDKYRILNDTTKTHVLVEEDSTDLGSIVEEDSTTDLGSIREDEIVIKGPVVEATGNIPSLQSTGQQSLEEAKK
jgi:hypothetical protein